MKADSIQAFLILLILSFSTCTNKLPGDTKANLGLLSFLSKIKSSPVIPCRKYQKKLSANSSTLNTSTGISVTKTNSTTCNFDLNSKSLFCAYEFPVGFFGNPINSERKSYKTILDFIDENKIPFKSKHISEIDNENPATRKDLSYTEDGKLIQILELNGTLTTVESYDSLGRSLLRKTKIGICSVTVPQTYDDAKKTGTFSFIFSTSTPAACPGFFQSINFSDLKVELFYDSDIYITKQISTTGVFVSTITYTTVEVGEVCDNPVTTNP